MKQLFLMVDSGNVKLIETPAPIVKDDTVLVETLYSAVSAGTERSLTSFGKKGLIGKALERPDQVKKVLEKMSIDGILTTFEATMGRLGEPMPMGYSGVGKVIACGRGITEVSEGDTVAMMGPAHHAEINRVPKLLMNRVSPEISDVRQCAFGALGCIALQGIHQAKVESGETVAVIGLGLLGHITARILTAYGCDVIAYDISNKTLPDTKLSAFILSGDDSAAEKTKSLTKGRGVDKVIITAAANSNQPMDLAAAIARDRGIICMIGVTQMEIDRRPYYEKELTFTIARSYGPGRYESGYEDMSVDYPIGHVRFTQGRNLEEFLRLIATKSADFSDLITHEIDFEKAESAYKLITDNPNHENVIGVLLRYSANPLKLDSVVKKPYTAPTSKDKLAVGLIGAGNFARNAILPTMLKNGNYIFKALATTGGAAAAQASDMFKFEYVTNDFHKLLNDEDIDLIAVSTRHDSHARFILEALKAGKHVYCEKPLCLTIDELNQIEAAYRASPAELFCGLNRRHAPLVKQLKSQKGTAAAVYDYIVNAGFLPENHWTHDEKTGGGRIIGEACHFVDTLQYLEDSELESLSVSYAVCDSFPKKDNAIINLRFSSGSIGNIIYTSMGSKKYSKEQLRVFSSGSIWELDNFIRMKYFGTSKKTIQKLNQDKGIESEYAYIFNVIQGKIKNDSIEDAFKGHRLLLSGIAE